MRRCAARPGCVAATVPLRHDTSSIEGRSKVWRVRGIARGVRRMREDDLRLPLPRCRAELVELGRCHRSRRRRARLECVVGETRSCSRRLRGGEHPQPQCSGAMTATDGVTRMADDPHWTMPTIAPSATPTKVCFQFCPARHRARNSGRSRAGSLTPYSAAATRRVSCPGSPKTRSAITSDSSSVAGRITRSATGQRSCDRLRPAASRTPRASRSPGRARSRWHRWPRVRCFRRRSRRR